mgnify:CR=1 FL=1
MLGLGLKQQDLAILNAVRSTRGEKFEQPRGVYQPRTVAAA